MTYQLKDYDNLGLFIACRALGLNIERADELIKLERTSFGERLEFEAVIKMIEAKNLLKQFDKRSITKKMTESLKKYPLENEFQSSQIESDKSCIEHFINKYGPVISLPQYYVLQRIKQFFSDNGHEDESRIFDVKYDRNEYRLGTLNDNENNISLSILLMALNVSEDKTKELIGKYGNEFDKQTEFILVIKMIEEMNLFDGFTIEEYKDDTLSEFLNECLNKYSITGGLTLGQIYSDRGRWDYFLEQYKELLSREHLYAFHRIRDFLRENGLEDESAILNIKDYKLEDLDCTEENIGFGIALCALQIPLSEAKKLIKKKKLEDVRHKKIEFIASIKLIKERNLFVCFSKIIYKSETLNKVIKIYWDKELPTYVTDQQRIKYMTSHSDSNISDAEMNALLRFKEFFIKNGLKDESVLLDVKYTSDHVKYIYGRKRYRDPKKYTPKSGHDIDHIVPYKVLQHVSNELGYNLFDAVHFTKHFDRSYNKQYLLENDNRVVKNNQINKFLNDNSKSERFVLQMLAKYQNNILNDNTNREHFVVQMIKEYQNTIRNKVQESINKDEYSEYKETNQACLDKLDELLDYKKHEVSELVDVMAAINIQQMAHPAHEDASAILDIQIKENEYKIEDLDCTEENIGFCIVLCALQIPLAKAKELIEKEKDKKKDIRHKKIELLASIKLIKEMNLFECFSKESYESEELNNIIKIHWHKELLMDGSDQQRIKSMTSLIDSTISEAEMYALLRFKRFFINNGHSKESEWLDVKYTGTHIRYLCQRLPEEDIDHIVPFKVLHYVSKKVGNNFYSAAYFAVHFDQLYNRQRLSIIDNRGVKTTQIKDFLKDNTKRGKFVVQMIKEYQNTIRNKVQESMEKVEYRNKIDYKACINELDKLFGIKKEEISAIKRHRTYSL